MCRVTTGSFIDLEAIYAPDYNNVPASCSIFLNRIYIDATLFDIVFFNSEGVTASPRCRNGILEAYVHASGYAEVNVWRKSSNVIESGTLMTTAVPIIPNNPIFYYPPNNPLVVPVYATLMTYVEPYGLSIMAKVPSPENFQVPGWRIFFSTRAQDVEEDGIVRCGFDLPDPYEPVGNLVQGNYVDASIHGCRQLPPMQIIAGNSEVLCKPTAFDFTSQSCYVSRRLQLLIYRSYDCSDNPQIYESGATDILLTYFNNGAIDGAGVAYKVVYADNTGFNDNCAHHFRANNNFVGGNYGAAVSVAKGGYIDASLLQSLDYNFGDLMTYTNEQAMIAAEIDTSCMMKLLDP